MFITAIAISLLQAPPPPVVFRDHAPPPRSASIVSVDCGTFDARIARTWSQEEGALELEVGGQDVSEDDIAVIRDNTPILSPRTGVAALCHPDSLLVEVQDGADRFTAIFVGNRLDALLRNNHNVWRASRERQMP